MAFLPWFLSILSLVAFARIVFLKKSIDQSWLLVTSLDEAAEALASAINAFKDELKPLEKARRALGTIKGEYTKIQKRYTKSLGRLKAWEERLQRYYVGVGTVDRNIFEMKCGPSDLDEKESELARVKESINRLVRDKKACVCKLGDDIVVNNKRSEAKKFINREIKLRLRCFDNEVKVTLAIVNWNNINRLCERLWEAFDIVNARGLIVKTELQKPYLEANMKLLLLTYEVAQIKRAIKEREREELAFQRAAEREDEKIRRAAEVAEEARARMESLVASELARFDQMTHEQRELLDLHREELAILREREARSVSMAQLTRSGYVYVITNVASFGSGVTKIGMTRRVNPFERVIELGDASVPELFEVKAFYFTEDAPALEKVLHQMYADKRINLVNLRKEFFYVDPDDVVENMDLLIDKYVFERIDPKSIWVS